MEDNMNVPSHDFLDIADLDNNIDDDEVMTRPHFLDYDSVPPAGYEDCSETRTEYLNFGNSSRQTKHFLDENPIPPDYMVHKREHRSLERNFEKVSDCNNKKYDFRTQSLTRQKEINTWPSTRSVADNGEHMESLHSSMPSKISEEAQQLGPKVICVYSLISMLGSNDSSEMSKKFLELSSNRETCASLRNSGCIPFLVQMIQSDIQSKEGTSNKEISKRSILTLQNIAHSNPDERAGRREQKVLRLIEQLLDYCSFLKTLLQSGGEAIADATERHPLASISSLMKVSFDEEHRQTMCMLGSLQVIARLVHLDHAVHGPKPGDQCCSSLRRFALMSLTNLTFGDDNNKALLCSNKPFMKALVAQLDFAPDDLLQVTASVLRNLSWRVDNNMKTMLNDIGTITALTKAAMKNGNENTLKAILSALWNLSAHCSKNKAEFCNVDGSLSFLVQMLSYEGPSKTLKITENAGGILKNVSNHIAVSDAYRKILREKNCLSILLQQLKSESLTVVSNSCGTLWNLSARCPEDQKFLWDNGAVPMLRSLIHSKHKLISEGSSAALKNLVNFRPGSIATSGLDSVAKSMGLKELPSLNARKQKALEEALDTNLGETCENDEVATPLKDNNNSFTSNFQSKLYLNKSDAHFSKEKVNKQMTSTIDLPEDHSSSTKSRNYPAYQETDLDQPTDFSLRYIENESLDIEIDKTDDVIKCYQTEDTPYISKAPSVGDLRKDIKADIFTPEKPIHYYEEGTPDKFSRRDSVSSLEETGTRSTASKINNTEQPQNEEKKKTLYSALETPLMFSRQSSMDSIEEDGQLAIDDKVSEISDFSRLASGVISPSDIPDSPTQSLSQSPTKMHMEINQLRSSNDGNKFDDFNSSPDLNKLSNKKKIEPEISSFSKKQENNQNKNSIISDEEGDDSGDLLASCINLGMNKKKKEETFTEFNDSVKTFYTEDTPALSKSGSISNLARVVDTSDVIIHEQYEISEPIKKHNFQPPDPIEMLKSGGPLNPYQHQHTQDEVKKFLLEDSPCNFSIVSGFSHLTVDSEKVEVLKYKRNVKQNSNTNKSCEGSISSFSNESDDDNKLLVQAIEAGFNRQKEIVESPKNEFYKTTSSLPISSTYKVQAELYDSSMESSDDNQSKSLFEQCIISGMNKQRILVGQPSSSDSDVNIGLDHAKLPTIPTSSTKNIRGRQHKHRNQSEDKLLYDCIKVGMTSSKNVETTSVAALEQTRMETITSNSATNTAPGVDTKTLKLQTTVIGTNVNLNPLQQQTTGFEVEEDDENTLKDIDNDDLSFEIIENNKKQKDPNLMLKSVERLTKNFMSTAEHLRNLDSKNNSSNNTWSDDYCPNGISFPVVSQDGPDLNDYDVTECLEDISKDRVNVIDFKVGGEVTVSCNSTLNCKSLSLSSSNLTNSMIANEANLIANNLLNNLSISSQSLDIEQIRPPSCMEAINYSGCFEQLLSPKLSNFRKKSLPSGIMAKRALGGKYELLSSNALTRNGSVENISRSTFNIDNINPPSIMDEMMDSMISVSSIQSEVVDYSYESKYETAFETINTLESDIFDENTITLESCVDQIPNLPNDDATPIPSDMSSGESTPTKSIKKPLTPKQRRHISKDRYKTYTITSELLNKVLLESNNESTKALTNGLLKEPQIIEQRFDYFTFVENAEVSDSLGKAPSSYSTIVTESDYNSMENDRISDISNEIVLQEKDSGTDMVYSGDDLTPSAKIIRGRKKPTYVSPYRQQKFINRSSSNIKTKPKENSELIRQNTFTKDEPTNEDVPVVDMPGTKKLPSKIISAKFEEKSSVKKKKQNHSSIPKVFAPQRSNSTALIKISPSIKLSRTNIPSTQPPSRSNSTLSKINGNKLNQIGSKISGIWKNKSNLEMASSSATTNNKINRNKTNNDKQVVVNPHKVTENSILKIKKNTYKTSPTK
ncbi:APC2 family protein [Megaselia abdita]